MKIKKLKWPKAIIPIMLTVAVILLFADDLMAQTDKPGGFFPGARVSEKSLLTFSVFLVLGAIAFAAWKVYKIIQSNLQKVQDAGELELDEAVKKLNAKEISEIQKVRNRLPKLMIWLVLAVGTPLVSSAQDLPATRGGMMSEPGVVITILLVLIPIFAGVVFALFKARRSLLQFFESRAVKREVLLARGIARETKKFSDSELRERKERLEFALSDDELSGTSAPGDDRGLIGNIKTVDNPRFFSVKRPSIKRPKIDPQLSNLILWYLGTAVFWLLLGTSAGEYVGIKFTAPDLDSISWLSIGRLRPVHTNLVFWGWSTLGIMGLGYYIVPTVSNAKINNLRRGYLSLILVNVAMLAGMILLMAGINNGGGEYREIVWPAMAVWGYGLFLTLLNFISTVSKRTTKEIYISNWYIISAYIFILIVATIAYLPMGQNGIGETIIQGYYMHQAVGMWFMFSLLGILYYLLPQQLNKPLYSYGLGILAFWSQILFYTVIGTHHFVFSALPWWLQTVAIVGSVGMLIPVSAGTINFLMTMRGSWSRITNSYSLPFFLVGVIYYFTGSFQGTAEAFRSTNLIWHFSDFTIAHSHITMYGIIAFLLFGGIYAIVPRLTGKEPSELAVGAHFWTALIGLQFYTIPLMIGGTLKGLDWAEGKPFIDSVALMAPYWLWRAIGGTLMWMSHIVLAYNLYKMIAGRDYSDIRDAAFLQLEQTDTDEKKEQQP